MSRQTTPCLELVSVPGLVPIGVTPLRSKDLPGGPLSSRSLPTSWLQCRGRGPTWDFVCYRQSDHTHGPSKRTSLWSLA